jgi:hypothetical protein
MMEVSTNLVEWTTLQKRAQGRRTDRHASLAMLAMLAMTDKTSIIPFLRSTPTLKA